MLSNPLLCVEWKLKASFSRALSCARESELLPQRQIWLMPLHELSQVQNTFPKSGHTVS